MRREFARSLLRVIVAAVVLLAGLLLGLLTSALRRSPGKTEWTPPAKAELLAWLETASDEQWRDLIRVRVVARWTKGADEQHAMLTAATALYLAERAPTQDLREVSMALITDARGEIENDGNLQQIYLRELGRLRPSAHH